jgi:RNA polymerase sigma-70 factor (ECF subfamily)
MPQDSFDAINAPEFLAMLMEEGAVGQKAFARLVRVTHDRFLGFIRRQLSSPDECQEVLQEVYLAVHKGLAGFAGRSKLSTWMFSLAHHKICDRLGDRDRKHKELTEDRAAILSTEGISEGWDRISPWDAPSDRVSERNRAALLIAQAMDSLSKTARQVYHLRDVEGFSGEEVARMVGISEANARVQLHRARRQIVDWVQERMREKTCCGRCPSHSIPAIAPATCSTTIWKAPCPWW